MGWSFDIAWWGWVLIFLYLFMVHFGIGAALGLAGSYAWISTTVGRKEKEESRAVKIFASLLFGLLGGFVNYGIVKTFS